MQVIELESALKQTVKTALGWAGLYDQSAASSYAAGAEVPLEIPIPEIPGPVPAGVSAAELAAAEEEALAARIATPAGFEPGLMEDLAGLVFNVENVESVLDDMVRPALNADGGDITLIRIENDDVFVKMIGACSTCPSSIMTMKMGVERLLQEEFPQMGELVNVDDPWG